MKATITKTRLALLPACVLMFILSAVHSSSQGAPAVMESKEVTVVPRSDVTIPIRFAGFITHWRVQVTAADNWRHGSQKNEWGTAWTSTFGSKVGLVAASDPGWYAEWSPGSLFIGTLVGEEGGEGGEGTGDEPKYQLTLDVAKPSGYMIMADRLYAAVGDPEGITLTAWIGDGEGSGAKEKSDWPAVADITFDPGPAENTDTVKVTTSEPGVYTIEGTSTDQTTLTDSVELTILKVEIKAEDGEGDPSKYICAGGEKSYTAVVTPEVPGEYAWSKANDKIANLSTDTSGQTVTVYAGSEASEEIGQEILRLEFTPHGSTDACVAEHELTVTRMKLHGVNGAGFALHEEPMKNHPNRVWLGT